MVGTAVIVYLCGAINAQSDDACKGWREEAKQRLTKHQIRDPMRRDYRGQEAGNVTQIVVGDLDDIRMSDVVLVNAQRPSWGTAMELYQAHLWGKRVLAFGAGDRPSPWLLHHAKLVPTLEDALAELDA